MEKNIFDFIERQDCAAMRRAFSSTNVNDTNVHGYTPLYYACMKTGVGALAVEELLRLGAQVDLQGQDRETPLYIACLNGKIDVVLLLLEKRANVNMTNGRDNETALHAAARTGNCALIDILLRNGAKINEQNVRKETALHLAAKMGLHDAVYHLMKAGADRCMCDIDGKDSLHVASERGLKHVVVLLKCDLKDAVYAKARADEILRSRPPPIRSSEAIIEEAESDAAAGRPIHHSFEFEAPEETKPLEILEIVVPWPKAGSRNPFAGVSRGPCSSLEEVGYDIPPPIPPALLNRSPVKQQRIGGTLMRIGTGIDTVGVEPQIIGSILGDSMEFATPLEK